MRTVANISRGATEFIEAVRVTNLSRYLDTSKRGGSLLRLDERGGTALWEIDLRGPVCLVFGGEKVTQAYKRYCDAV